MSASATPSAVKGLGRLVELRGQQVDQLQGVMAGKQAVLRRYESNLQRMTALCAGESVRGTAPIALAANRADYKDSVLQMITQHRQDMTLHEQDMAVTRQALVQASQNRLALSQALAQRQQGLALAQQRQECKRQDELATQVWRRSGGAC